jgi:hypothetical protein
MYTKEQVEKAILSLNFPEAYIKSAGLVRACEYAAVTIFTYEVKEDENSEIIRQALKDLREDGCFKFQN